MSSEAPGYLGPYRLLNIVNTGQTSQMWQTYHDGFQRFFAVKTLLERFRRSREQIGYLKWEYTVGLKLQHERIIQITEYNTDRGTPYLAMEWFAAPNMKQRIRQGVDNMAHLVTKICVQATDAVAYFNGRGWVHRDIKPDNFLVNDEGDVKLIDFALTQRRRGLIGKLITPKSKVQGTRSYMSPEQIRGSALDDRADLYSLGCTLFELASGKPPFTGASANDLLMKHLKASPPSLESANRNVTPEFAKLIRRAMAKKPSARQKSTADFLNELRVTPVFRVDPQPPQEAKTSEN